MIGKLKGRVESTGDDFALLDVGGVCYRVFLSGRGVSALPAIGEAVVVWVETQVREDHIHLYGFLTAEEQQWFRLLCTVQGVGAKMAQAILSSLAPDEIQQAIAAKDTKLLTRANGVGAKLAERLVTELKGKIGKIAGGVVMPSAETSPTTTKGKAAVNPLLADNEAAISALVNLGYGRSEAFAAISLARQKNPEASLDDLIRKGLQELAR
jgi:Holliday junction DNA helicase RuvA